MYISYERPTKLTRPTILVIQPFRDLGDLIRDDLAELGYTVNVVHTRAAALASLAPAPDIVILDVVMSQINIQDCLEHLQRCRSDGRLSLDEYSADLHQLEADLFAEEEERAGIALAQQILIQLPGIPVIFTSTERVHLRSLPFGESFCWWSHHSESLFSMVERIVSTHVPPHQTAQPEAVGVIELSRKEKKMYMLAAA